MKGDLVHTPCPVCKRTIELKNDETLVEDKPVRCSAGCGADLRLRILDTAECVLKLDPGPLAHLLAAEAEFLQSRGWAPYSLGNGHIAWQDPSDSSPALRFRQGVAIGVQRLRETGKLDV